MLAKCDWRAQASPLTFRDFKYLGSGPFRFSQPSVDGVDLVSLHSWRPRPRRPPPRRPPRPRRRSRRSRPPRRRRRRSERPRAPLATRGIIGRGKVSPAPPHTSVHIEYAPDRAKCLDLQSAWLATLRRIYLPPAGTYFFKSRNVFLLSPTWEV